MKIIVCAKQVPDTNEVKIDPIKGTLIRDGVPSILNPDDANALEAALALKDKIENTTISVLSMGPPQATTMLRECLAMGADDAYLLSSRTFGGADTCATSITLAAGIAKIGTFDIIFAGRQAIDGDTAQVGPQVAQRLGLPVVTYVQNVREIKANSVVVERQMEDGYQVIECQTPCVLTCVKELNQPRTMSIAGIERAYAASVAVWNEQDIDLDASRCGLKASPTQVLRSFTPPTKGRGAMLSGTAAEMASTMIRTLRSAHVIG